MRFSAAVEWAAHCLLALAALPEGASAPATRLAALHELPEASMAKHLQALRRAGLVRGGQGRRGGYVLARAPREVSLLDVVGAIHGPEPLFTCTEIRGRGPFAPPASSLTRRCDIATAFDRAERAWRSELSAISIADLADAMPPDIEPAARWLSRPDSDTS